MKFLCKIGPHKPYTTTHYLPSISAPIVTDAITRSTCLRCGKSLYRSHLKWDAEKLEMVETEPEAA